MATTTTTTTTECRSHTALVEYFEKFDSSSSSSSFSSSSFQSVQNVLHTLSSLPGFPAHWMSTLLPLIGSRSLESICIPRAHDAGMYDAPARYRRMGTASTTLTQTCTISQQLELGVRMFDLRPCLSDGVFSCGHYKYINSDYIPEELRALSSIVFPALSGWYSGGEGVLLADVVRQVNAFTRKSKGEVIIVEVSHAFNFDKEVHNDEWGHALNQEEWDELIAELRMLEGLYISESGAPITKVAINELVSAGHSAVIVAVECCHGVGLPPSVAGRGFFDRKVLDPLRRYRVTRQQTPIEAVCGYLMDKNFPVMAKRLASIFRKDSPYLKEGCWSIIEVAKQRKITELPKVLANPPADGGCWNVVSMDDVDGVELLDTVIRVIGHAINGENVPWKLGDY